MLKLTVAMLAVVLAGTASAERWRDLRVDASSEDAFAQSLETFKDKLSPARIYVFGEALRDIWRQGAKAAAAEQREYTAEDYYAQLHGLSYDEVVKLTDPTGDTAKARYRMASLNLAPQRSNVPGPNWGSRPAGGWGTTAASTAQMQQQCGCASPMGPQGN